MLAEGDVVSFINENDQRAVYGQIVIRGEGRAVVLDTDGCFYCVSASILRGPGEKTPDGEILIPKAPIMVPSYDDQGNVTGHTPRTVAFDIKRETDKLLADPFVRITIKRLRKMPEVRPGLIGRVDGGKDEPYTRTMFASYEIPLKLIVLSKPEKSGHQWTVQFENYLMASEVRRKRLENVLNRLRERAPIQHKIYVACVLGGRKQSDVCRAFGLQRSNASAQLRKAIHFVKSHMGENVLGD